MSGSKPMSYEVLEKPEKFQDVLKRDRGDDCISCKVVGTGVFMGLGAYSYFSGMAQLEKQQAKIIQRNTMFGMRSRRLGITSISLAFVGMGVWRACK